MPSTDMLVAAGRWGVTALVIVLVLVLGLRAALLGSVTGADVFLALLFGVVVGAILAGWRYWVLLPEA